MKPERLSEAIGQIDDDIIKEVDEMAERNESKKKSRKPIWIAIGSTAACCAIAAAVIIPMSRNTIPTESTDSSSTTASAADLMPEITDNESVTLLAKAEYPDLREPVYEAMEPEQNGASENQWDAYESAIKEYLKKQKEFDVYKNHLPNLSEKFWGDSMSVFLSAKEGENMAFSPSNTYMALAMVAETADGESRQQILDALGADSIETLRNTARALWRDSFCDSPLNETKLANSMWLGSSSHYNTEVLQKLVDYYYASAYSCELGSEEHAKALRNWLDENTGGMLTDEISNIQPDPMAAFGLASTVYYKAQWVDEFREKNNTDGVFTRTDGTEQKAEFMNYRNDMYGYYQGDGYIAAFINLEDNDKMWFLLPDEGITPEQLVKDGAVYQLLYGEVRDNRLLCDITLSLPKFDITTESDCISAIKQLGITDVFDAEKADFSPLTETEDSGMFIGKVNNAVRVSVDENGVSAASYIAMDYCGSALPEEVPHIDFILDRPFIYVIESGDIPLFCGVVNSLE